MDAIRIKTDSQGKRKGKLISTAFEAMLNPTHEDVLLYRINIKELVLFDIEDLTDGEYPKSLFKTVGVAAPVVLSDMETPVTNYPDCYRYVGTEEHL